MSNVLVTGGAGFIAIHCVRELLAAGHDVRVTLRDLRREAEVMAMLPEGARLKCFAAELESDTGWNEAIRDVEYVLHVASPTLTRQPKDDDDFVQAGALVRTVMDDAARNRLVSNVVGHLAAGVSEPVLQRAFAYWRNIDKEIGDRIAKGTTGG